MIDDSTRSPAGSRQVAIAGPCSQPCSGWEPSRSPVRHLDQTTHEQHAAPRPIPRYRRAPGVSIGMATPVSAPAVIPSVVLRAAQTTSRSVATAPAVMATALAKSFAAPPGAWSATAPRAARRPRSVSTTGAAARRKPAQPNHQTACSTAVPAPMDVVATSIASVPKTGSVSAGKVETSARTSRTSVSPALPRRRMAISVSALRRTVSAPSKQSAAPPHAYRFPRHCAPNARTIRTAQPSAEPSASNPGPRCARPRPCVRNRFSPDSS